MDSPKKRKRWSEQDKWDKENVTTLGCKVKRTEAAAFKSYAEKRGKRANTVLKDYVLACIKEDEEGEQRNIPPVDTCTSAPSTSPQDDVAPVSDNDIPDTQTCITGDSTSPQEVITHDD